MNIDGSSLMCPKVVVVYLAFHPSIDDLAYVNDLAQNVAVIVVSNSGPHDFGLHVVAEHIFENNVGVGAGYNAGVMKARDLGASNILFHDQDSRVDPTTIDAAHDRLGSLLDGGQRAVLSLNPVDIATNTSRTARVTFPVAFGDLFSYQDVQFSGLLVPWKAFDDWPPFSEDLFVDFVDSAWCWKVARTTKILRDPSLVIGHQLGSGTRKILGVEYSMPSPKRFFFQVRNLVWLAGRPYVPSRWPIQTAGKFLARSIVLPLLEPEFWSCWKESVRGVIAGLRDRRAFALSDELS